MQWDWGYTWRIVPRLIEGLAVTVEATILATLLALAVGLLIAIGKRSRHAIVRLPVHWSAEFVRRTPLLVQIYLIFFVLPDAGIDLEQLEAHLIRRALVKSEGNKSQAARLLGMTRRTLYSRMEKHGIQE